MQQTPFGPGKELVAIPLFRLVDHDHQPGAGLAGALKLLVQLRQAAMPPNAQLRVLNPHVGAATRDVSCVLPAQLSLASSGAAGGVSAFGYGGTIAHAVMSASAGGASGDPLLAAPSVSYRRRAFAWSASVHPLLQEVA